MITKAQLRAFLGHPGPAIAHKTLTRRLIKDGILEMAGVTWEEIRQEQYLPPHVTSCIYQIYRIQQI
jgi:hypothetical protein